MRAWLLEQPSEVALDGAASGPLMLREIPRPEPGPGEVRLKVQACGLNRAE